MEPGRRWGRHLSSGAPETPVEASDWPVVSGVPSNGGRGANYLGLGAAAPRCRWSRLTGPDSGRWAELGRWRHSQPCPTPLALHSVPDRATRLARLVMLV